MMFIIFYELDLHLRTSSRQRHGHLRHNWPMDGKPRSGDNDGSFAAAAEAATMSVVLRPPPPPLEAREAQGLHASQGGGRAPGRMSVRDQASRRSALAVASSPLPVGTRRLEGSHALEGLSV